MVLDGETFGFKTQVIQKTDLLAVKLENSESTKIITAWILNSKIAKKKHPIKTATCIKKSFELQTVQI